MEHKIILGGERYLPLARRMVKQLRSLGLPYATKTLLIDKIEIKARIEPGHDHILIQDTDVPLYQFFCSGTSVFSGEFESTIKGYALRVEYDRKDKDADRLKANALGSTLEPSTDDPPKWKYYADPDKMSDLLPYRKSFQIQALPEPQYFPGAQGPLFIGSAWTASNEVNDLSVHGANRGQSTGTDVGYDMAPSLFRKRGNPRIAAPDADWYRRAAYTRVDSAVHGSRSFCLMTDVSGYLHVYPANEVRYDLLTEESPYLDQSIKTTVRNRFVLSKNIPHPAWAQPYPATAARDDDDPLNIATHYPPHNGKRWAFNSTGTRMVSVTLGTVPIPPLGDTPDKPELIGQSFGFSEATMGLVEVGIQITITGANSEDFEVELATVREFAPGAGRYFAAADYYWGDLEGQTATSLHKDDLMTIELDMYQKPGASTTAVEASYSELLTTATVKRIGTDSDLIWWTFTTSHRKPPHGMHDTGISGSFIRWYHGEIKPSVDSAISSVPNLSARSALNGIIADLYTYYDNITTITPDTQAKYEHLLSDCANRMRAYMLDNYPAYAAAFADSMRLVKVLARDRLVAQVDDHLMFGCMLAYDLRCLAFATQTSVFMHDGDTVQRGDRLRVQVRGKVEHTDTIGSPEWEALAAGYDLVPDLEGFTRIPPTLNRNPSTSMLGVYLLYGTKNSLGRQGTAALPETLVNFNTDYPVGVAAYSVAAMDYFSGTPFDVFCAHPAGHWSIVTQPVVGYVGVCQKVITGKKVGFDVSNFQPDPGLFSQKIIDLISVRVSEKNATTGAKEFREIKSNHIDLFNAAYGKSFAKSNLLYQFGLTRVAYGNTAIECVSVAPPVGDAGVFGHMLHDVRATTLAGTVYSYSPLSYADMRADRMGGPYGTAEITASEITLKRKEFSFHVPVLRGACLFGGEKEVEL